MAATSGQKGLKLRALLYCVFDKEEGPIVCCSDPPNAIDREQGKLGRYLLPEIFVKGRVVSLLLDEMDEKYIVMGAPVYIEDARYPRNCFQFNICSIISSSIDVEPYRDLAQHLAMAFESLETQAVEMQDKFLSGASNVETVRVVLAELRQQLNESGECFVRVTDSQCISFRVWNCSSLHAPEPNVAEVPVPLVDLKNLLLSARRTPDAGGSLKLPFEPDLALLHLVPYIDGIQTVDELIHVSSLEKEVVVICLQHLVHFGLVAMIDAINLKSRYRLTPEFHRAFDRPEVANEVIQYVTVGRHYFDSEDASRQAFVGVIHGLYAQIDGWRETLEEFQKNQADELRNRGISLRHFITFGLLRGFLECSEKYSHPAEEASTEIELPAPWLMSSWGQELREAIVAPESWEQSHAQSSNLPNSGEAPREASANSQRDGGSE